MALDNLVRISMRVKAKGRYRNAAGLVIPSVTTAVSILDKPAMLRWANRLGLEGIDMNKYVDELADIGTLTHYFIMCRLRDELPEVDEFTPEQVRLAEACYKQYLDWEARNPVRCLLAEEPLISERYQYGGTFDMYGVCNKQFLLGDFKTNAKGIFPEMIYQVSAYRHLLIEAGYPVSKAVILRLGRGSSEGAEERILTDEELDTGFKIFIRCLEIYKLRRGEPI